MSIFEVRNTADTLLPPPPNYNSNSGLLDDINAVQQLEQQLEQQLGSTCNSLSSLEAVHLQEFSSGARRNGQMSAVRRFFCLFVLFDLLLISLTWLICMMLLGSNLLEILKVQVLHYNLTSSLFDVVLGAFSRFIILLLFYGLLQLNTTFFVALTTLGTSVFLIVKVIYYSWSTASQPAFQVILILMSFVVAWSEAWFLDFRVLPQELFALNYAQLSPGRLSESISTLLLDRNSRDPVMRHFLRNVGSAIGGPTESYANYYSPLASPNDSDDEGNNRKKEQGEGETGPLERPLVSHASSVKAIQNSLNNNDFPCRGKATLELAWSILNENRWELQKKSENGDCVYSKHETDLGKVFLLKAKINISPRKLLDELFLNVEKFPTWNKTILVSKKVEAVDDHTDITYQVSAPGGNGLISSRDFVILRRWDLKGDVFVLAGISVVHDRVPPVKSHIRGKNGPCCWVMRPHGENSESCSFEFLLSTDLKGWIPQYVLDSSLTTVLLEYSSCLKEHCKTLKKLGNPCLS